MDNLFGEEIVDISTGIISQGGQSYEYLVSNGRDMTKLLQRLIDCEWMEVTGGPGGWDNVLWIRFKVPGSDKTYVYDQNIFVEDYEPDTKLRARFFQISFREYASKLKLHKNQISKSYEGIPDWVFDKLADIFNDIANNIKCGNEQF